MRRHCAKCGRLVAEFAPGSALRRGAVLLCADCWRKAEAAMGVAEQVQRDVPDFLRGLFAKEGG